jgi:uncharacterized membrane protein YbhN (UPF0104 family)
MVSAVKMRLGRAGMAAAVAATLALVAVAATPQLYGSRVAEAFEGLGRADPAWLWLGTLGFLASLAGAAGSWHCAVRLCGGEIGFVDANARYGTGSLVNTFLPARLGDAVRLALYSRALDTRHRLWTTGGAFAVIGAARAVALAALVVAGALAGALPLWPVAVLAAMVAAAGAVAWRSRTLRSHSRVAAGLAAFRAIGSDPRAAVRIVGWIAFATVGRFGATAAIAASLGVHRPLAAAVIILPALDVATLLPLTPGNVGVTSGAVAFALQAHGIGHTQALSTGIAFHATETAVSLLYGACGVLVVAGGSLTGTRRWLAYAAGTAASLALVGAFGATVVAPLVS